MQKIFPIHINDAKIFPLETFEAPTAHKIKEDMKIQIVHPEFSSVCPVTGYPDFARIIIRYVPDKLCVELKSWKLMLSSYYGVGCFHEDITQRISDTFLKAVNPKWFLLFCDWGARGGVKTTTSKSYYKMIDPKNPDTGVPIYEDIDSWPQDELASQTWQNT